MIEIDHNGDKFFVPVGTRSNFLIEMISIGSTSHCSGPSSDNQRAYAWGIRPIVRGESTGSCSSSPAVARLTE